jgi:F420H(2)-dependent quinone reductase
MKREKAARSGALCCLFRRHRPARRDIKGLREVGDDAERSRLWRLALAAYPPYAEYQERTARWIPVCCRAVS